MKASPKLFLIFLLLVSTNVLAQCPPNIGFEDGTFSNWECWAGLISTTGVINVSLTPPIGDRHTIISADDYVKTDPYGHFPTLCPNGSKHSIRLGNSSTGKEAERVTYTFTVPVGAEYNLVFNYAVVLENPTHLDYQQPKFTAQIYDVTDNKYINCPSFDFIASADLPGFKLSDIGDATNPKAPASIYYKEWSATTINLVGYGGKQVRLEFTTNDCTQGGHFGYAYIDVNEECTSSITGNTYCTGQPSITLHAPSGFYDYFWYNAADLTTQIGHGETLTLNPAPPDQSKYALTIVPYPGLGCPDTLYTTINKINTDFKLVVPDTLYACKGSGVDLTAPSVTAGSSSDLILSYFTNPVTLDYIYAPKSITTAGTYYIRGINTEGCMNILPVYVKLVDAPALTVTDPQNIQYPHTVDLSKTYTPLNGLVYSYYSDAAATIALDNFKAIGVTGTYYVKAISGLGCEIVAPVHVVINPPPPYTISGANTFTPNNDGINDHFMLSIEGFASFVNLKVYNRYGQLLFNAKSLSDYWDGTYNGRQLPSGTYYWVFEGLDLYYHTKITKSGYIAIVR